MHTITLNPRSCTSCQASWSARSCRLAGLGCWPSSGAESHSLTWTKPSNSQCRNQHSFNQLLKHVCLLLYSGAVFANVEAEVRAGRNIGRGLSSSALGTLVLSKTVVRANESCRVNFSGLNVTVVDCRRVVIAGNLIFFESSLLASCRTSSRRSEALSNLSRMRIIAMTQARCVQTS